MKHFYLIALLSLCTLASAQIRINELDSDDASTDDMEFVELLSAVPNESLDGYVLVFFNGSTSGNDSSYFALDLDGFTTDTNGLFVAGSNGVSPVPDLVFGDNSIQNGADAVALYIGNDTDWPDQTPATTTNLIDALVYDTNDSDDQGLLTALGVSVQINEDENNMKDTQSIQLVDINQNTYVVADANPFSLTGVTTPSYIGLDYTASATELSEGDALTITFTTTQVVPADLVVNFTLNNGGFNNSDYTGPTSFTIAANTDTATVNFQIIDDTMDEGDEELRINVQNNLPDGYKRLIDNTIIRVVDNDFTVAAYGTPLAPTYGIVAPTTPAGYYDSLDGLSGTALTDEITNIIADENTVRHHTYTDLTEILRDADESPLNSNQVWLMYTEQQRPKLDFQGNNAANAPVWNREHIFPRSRANYFSIEEDDLFDGINVFVTTKRDSLRHGNSDAHGLRPVDSGENSSRGNQDYGEYTGPAGNAGSWNGDVARAIFYLVWRYNDGTMPLDVVNGNPPNSTDGQLGDLALLIQWHRNDPPDDYEMNRNNLIYTWQQNRNPFIDNPDLAEFIWGNMQGQQFVLSTNGVELPEIGVYPNPNSGVLNFSNLPGNASISIINALGQTVLSREKLVGSSLKHDLPAGVYAVRIEGGVSTKSTLRLIVK